MLKMFHSHNQLLRPAKSLVLTGSYSVSDVLSIAMTSLIASPVFCIVTTLKGGCGA